jgi:hypothetical protein
MFCPKCGIEYREGFSVCSDCNVPLVYDPPGEKDASHTKEAQEFNEYEEVLQTYSPSDIAFLKSLLDSAGIVYFFKGELSLSVQPMADRVRLMIRKDQVEEVEEILRDLKLSFIGTGQGHDSQEEPEF